jgi:hypothetical protein
VTLDDLLDDRREDRLARVIVDHVDDLSAIGVGQFVKVVVIFLGEDVLANIHALPRDALSVLLVMFQLKDVALVGMQDFLKLAMQWPLLKKTPCRLFQFRTNL